jgi:TatD DNase family protein
MLIDTHAHLYAPEFEEDIDDTTQRAIASGVNKVYLPNIDFTSIAALKVLCQKYPDYYYPMMGLHPCSVKENWRTELKIIEDELFQNQAYYAGVGETGTDLYWDKTYLEAQKESFEIQIGWAGELQKPIIIHSRDSLDLSISIIEQQKRSYSNLTGIFHCFNGTIEQAKKIVGLGFYLGIGGVLTFKNGGLDKILKELPIDRIVFETDAPYLAPVPHRGKRNETAFIRLVAEKAAEIYGISLESICATSTANALRVFTQ